MSKIESYLAKADQTLQGAILLLDSSHHDAAISRAYYAMLYGAEALLLSKDLKASTHGGVFTLLSRHFVATGMLDISFSRMFKRAGDKRQLADYAATSLTSVAEAVEIVNDARAFITRCRELLNP